MYEIHLETYLKSKYQLFTFVFDVLLSTIVSLKKSKALKI